MKTKKRYNQSGGTWKDEMKRGIRKASDQYRHKQKWYHMGPIASASNFIITKRNDQLMSQLIDAIEKRCQKMNIHLSEVSSKDFEKLSFYTRLIFLKQDLKQKSEYDILLKRIEHGKLDKDFKKYYKSFRYTKHSKKDVDGLFRKSVSKSLRKKYEKHRDERDLFKDIEKEEIDKFKRKSKKRTKTRRRSTKHK